MKHVRVLLVGNDADYFLTHRLPLAVGLAERGYDVHVAVPFERNDQRFERRPFVVHRISLQRGGVHVGHELQTIFQLLRLYRRLRPKIVHHVTLKPTLYGGFAARLTGIPIVVNAMTGLGFVFTSSKLKARLIRMLAKWPLLRRLQTKERDDDLSESGGSANICRPRDQQQRRKRADKRVGR